MNSPLLDIQNLHGGYTDTAILNGLSLTVNKGEMVAIVGANGAGKSTAMRAVFGLLKVFSGSIFFNQRDITSLATNRIVLMGISYVPQVRNIFTDLTIQENLEMGAFIRKDGLAKAFDYVYQFFPDLLAKKNTLAGHLSGGQRQMLAMGRALMLEPQLLLLDEPTAGLSPKYMQQIFCIIEKIKQQNVGVLLVEQHAKQALQRCDRGYVLSLGKNRFEGRGQDLLNDPNIIASFLGG